MKGDSFLDVLMSNDKESMEKFLQANGKKKPYSAIYFIPKEDQNNGRRKDDNEGINERDQGSNQEAEVGKQG